MAAAPPYTEFNNPLPHPHRFITTHDRQARFGLGYVTSSVPVHLNNDQDLGEFKAVHDRRKESEIVKHGGSVVRYVDYPPESSSPMHRTVSCDYAIVLFGNMECLLNSGETRTLKAGDVLVQRGTMHQWINHSNSWAGMLYVLLDAAPVEVDGKQLGQDLGGMQVYQIPIDFQRDVKGFQQMAQGSETVLE